MRRGFAALALAPSAPIPRRRRDSVLYQAELLYALGGGAGEARVDLNVARQHEAGDPLAQMPVQRDRIEGPVRREDDAELDLLLADGGRHTHGGRFAHGGKAQRGLFDFEGRNVLAAAADEVLE